MKVLRIKGSVCKFEFETMLSILDDLDRTKYNLLQIKELNGAYCVTNGHLLFCTRGTLPKIANKVRVDDATLKMLQADPFKVSGLPLDTEDDYPDIKRVMPDLEGKESIRVEITPHFGTFDKLRLPASLALRPDGTFTFASCPEDTLVNFNACHFPLFVGQTLTIYYTKDKPFDPTIVFINGKDDESNKALIKAVRDGGESNAEGSFLVMMPLRR